MQRQQVFSNGLCEEQVEHAAQTREGQRDFKRPLRALSLCTPLLGSTLLTPTLTPFSSQQSHINHPLLPQHLTPNQNLPPYHLLSVYIAFY